MVYCGTEEDCFEVYMSQQRLETVCRIYASNFRVSPEVYSEFWRYHIFWVLCRLALLRPIFLERSTFSALRVEIVRGLALGAVMSRGELSGEIAE